eukprot:3573068-Amphidinium_carterae.1
MLPACAKLGAADQRCPSCYALRAMYRNCRMLDCSTDTHTHEVATVPTITTHHMVTLKMYVTARIPSKSVCMNWRSAVRKVAKKALQAPGCVGCPRALVERQDAQ